MEDILGSIEQEDLTFAQRGETYETLNKVLSNIVANPAEPKFRTLKKENKLVSEKLSRSTGAISTLLALGFEDTGAAYVCPSGADLGPHSEVVDLLECILASRGSDQATTASPSTAAAATATATAAAAATATASAAAASSRPSVGSAAAAAAPGAFMRRDESEKKRDEHLGQLEAVRAAQRAQFADGGGSAGALRAAAPVAQEAAPVSSPDAKKKPPVKSAFDFENRGKKEQQQNKAVESLEDLRRAQKEKFKDFQSDPDARKAAAYQAPPSVAPGGKADQSWGDWFGGMFGGSSSGSSGGGGGGRPSDDRKPKMKTINDLPKPVQRG